MEPKNNPEVHTEDRDAQIPVDTIVIPRNYAIMCAITGKKETVSAGSFDEAGDLFVDNGWSYDRFIGGYVCPEARVV